MSDMIRFLKGEGNFRDFAKRGFLYFAMVVLFAAVVMFSYVFVSPAAGMMTAEGWIYLALASVGHAVTLGVTTYLIYLLIGGTGLRRPALWIMIILSVLMVVLLVVNRQVYAIYRFHINGFILNMLTGPGAGDIFVLDTWMVLKECCLLLLFAGATVGLYYLAAWVFKCTRKGYVWPLASVMLFCVLFGHLYHAYGAFTRHAQVVRGAVTLPYFYPLTAKSLLTKLGVKAPAGNDLDAIEVASGEIQFPLETLTVYEPDSLPDIYLILLDSWNSRGLTAEGMPNAWRFAEENTRFTEHLSSSNGTRCSVFGIYFGVPGYYWESFEAACVAPPMISRLQELGYKIQAYPAANLHNPDFRNMVFRNVADINEADPGATVLESDEKLTARFLADMASRDADSAAVNPHFSFLFYDLPHAIALPAERNTRFTPAWEYADYTRLNNDLNPTEFWNLYRNCLYEDDLLLGKVFDAIEEREAATGRKALVILSGDHGQEFNENLHNYWGHSSNFSKAQIRVPLVVRFPGGDYAGKVLSHRTTHYDFVPTIMGRYLGVENEPEVYSLGHDLTDSVADRRWHIAGANLNYAFVTPGDTILEKGGAGELNVYDPQMNPVRDYKVNAAEISAALEKLNRFFRK